MILNVFDRARRVTATDVAKRRGLALQHGSGKWTYKAKCPLHGEKTASLMFDNKGGWYCFGCNKGGQDGASFLAELDGISQYVAAKLLAGETTESVTREAFEEEQRRKRKATMARAFDELVGKWANERVSQLVDRVNRLDDCVDKLLKGVEAGGGQEWSDTLTDATQTREGFIQEMDDIQSAQSEARNGNSWPLQLMFYERKQRYGNE